MNNKQRKKIAILGGGLASLTAAYELAIQDRYDITVYQVGWRLGGQGASGRNQEDHGRIEEHGLHVWFGYYENAFNLMWRCYRELGRTPHQPLADVRQAFTGEDTFVFEEYINGEWRPWEITFPPDNGFPGIPSNLADPNSVTATPGVWEFIVRLLNFSRAHFMNNLLHQFIDPVSLNRPLDWEALVLRFAVKAVQTARSKARSLFDLSEIALIERAHALAASLHSDPATHHVRHHHKLHQQLGRFRELVSGRLETKLEDDEVRRHWIMLDLSTTCVIGMLKDEVPTKGFDRLNKYDLRDWLKLHGISDVSLKSALLQALYDLLFAYKKGDTAKPSLSAGIALLGSLRTGLAYKGHVLYRMNAGMGDTVFAPLYRVLKDRGVKFKFFHRVKKLELSGDKKSIGRILLARQVTLDDSQEYDPLIKIKGLDCWPSKPLYQQIREGDALKQNDVDLESRWAKWRDADPEVVLTAGSDFDLVLLGISVGALKFLCKELIEASADWKAMVNKIETVQTQQVQLWFKLKPEQLRFPSPGGIAASFVERESTWADFSHLIEHEEWPEAPGAKGLFYGCGVFKHARQSMPGPGAHEFPAEQQARVQKEARQLIERYGETLWPAAFRSRFNWSVLQDSGKRKGSRRLDAQYFHVNVDPSERYVQTAAGTDQYRLRANGSGFPNLFLTGTWIDHGYNVSCVEAAVMSGMAASRAISGKPKHIVGGRPPGRPKKASP